MRRFAASALLATVILAVLAAPACAADWYVDVVNGSDTYSGDTTLTAFKSITKGLSVAASGDAVHVAPGSYEATTSAEVFPLGMKSGVVLLGADADAVAIRGNGTAAVIAGTGVDADAKVDGFTITGGEPGLDFTDSYATVSNNVITGNTGGYAGAGVHSEGGALRIADNVIADNWAWFGAGICSEMYDQSIVEDNLIEENTGYYGVGVGCYYHAEPTIRRNTIRGNVANAEGWNGRASGAGIVAESAALPRVSETVIEGNRAEGADGTGGAIHLYSASAILVNCLITGNVSADYAISGVNSGLTAIVNSTIADNSPAGIGRTSTTWPFTVDVRNSIVRGHAGVEIETASAGDVTYSDVEGGWSGEGNIDADPLFAVPGADYRLTTLSPCRDSAAEETSVVTDLDGVARPQGAGWDMGAYEYVAVPAAPPVADAGGPYSGVEGDAVTLDGSGSSDPDRDIVAWAWDLDGDGEFDDATGERPAHAFADDFHGSIRVRVTDSAGLSAEASAQVNVENAAPLAELPVTSGPVRVGAVVEVSSAFSDAGAGDTHIAVIDWGDGTTSVGTVTEGDGHGVVSGSHTYSAPALCSVTVTVADDDGGSSAASALDAVAVYDPRGFTLSMGVVAPSGAVSSDPDLSGRIRFSFSSRYVGEAAVPLGSIGLEFWDTGAKFLAPSQEWLVVSQVGKSARLQGRGTIDGANSPNGQPYTCRVWANDALPDTVRVRISYEAAGGVQVVVYDTGTPVRLTSGNVIVGRK